MSELRERIEAVLMDANVTYSIADDEGGSTPMMVERAAIVQALGYADESAWLARTAEINAAKGAFPVSERPAENDVDAIHRGVRGSSWLPPRLPFPVRPLVPRWAGRSATFNEVCEAALLVETHEREREEDDDDREP